MKSVRGLRILITGPARGIGAEVARQLATEGARVALVGLESDLLESLCNELGPDHIWAECDVTDFESLKRATEKAVSIFGGLDVVIANAGIGSRGTVAITPVSAMVKTIEVNLTGTLQTVAATLPTLTESRGYYLLISSSTALYSIPGMAAYSASKIGVEHFANSFRLEVAHKGIEVGVVTPSWIETDLILDQQTDLPSFNEMLARLPWPFREVTSVEKCGRAIVDAVRNRRRKKYVPAALAHMAAIRQLFKSPLWEFFVKRNAHIAIPKAEAEVNALGRSFGIHSVESSDRTEKSPKS